MIAKFYIDTRVKPSLALTKEEWQEIFVEEFDFVAGVEEDVSRLYPQKSSIEAFEEVFKQYFVEHFKRIDTLHADVVCCDL